MQGKSKESLRNEYKNAWRKEKQDEYRVVFQKELNIKERLKNAAIARNLSPSALIREYALEGLKRDGY